MNLLRGWNTCGKRTSIGFWVRGPPNRILVTSVGMDEIAASHAA